MHKRIPLLLGFAFFITGIRVAMAAPECKPPMVQVADKCVYPRAHISYAGCCYKGWAVQKSFAGGWEIAAQNCQDTGEQCLWVEYPEAQMTVYSCGPGVDNKKYFDHDPTGQAPKECDFTCDRECDGRECGPDLCGGECGTCKSNEYCEDGKCRPCTCDGKECGDDGCGHPCGKCPEGITCVVDKCAGPNSIPFNYGCCYKDHLVTQAGVIGVTDCEAKGGRCGWIDWGYSSGSYGCEPSIDADPTGAHPKECDLGQCTPDCMGKNCGPDGCGGTCGTCKTGEKCLLDQTCCQPDCESRDCGSDGCGEKCGYCDDYRLCDNGICTEFFGCSAMPFPGCPNCACEKCVESKDPTCGGLYPWGEWDFDCADLCKNECGGCKPCVPDCTGKQCGDDGCHGQCGYCKAGDECINGQCVNVSCDNIKCKDGESCYKGNCKPCTCKDRVCGDDGCGHSCGKCPAGQACTLDGRCMNEAVCTAVYSDSGQCSVNPCTGKRYKCGYGYRCDEETNNCAPCAHYCADDWECGSDTCNASCGECGVCEQCISHHCKPVPDCVAPDTGPEPIPDRAEDVFDAQGPDQTKSDVPMKDPDIFDTTLGKDTHKTDLQPVNDKTSPADTIQTDIGKPKSNSGGCTTTSTGNTPHWMLLLFAGLLYLRKHA